MEENIDLSKFQISFREVIKNVNFFDTPIILLMIYHLFFLRLTLMKRNQRTSRNILFMFFLAETLFSERIGNAFEKNWGKIGFSNNYFDEFGVFLITFFSMPPILNCIILLSVLISDIIVKLITREKMNPNDKIKKE